MNEKGINVEHMQQAVFFFLNNKLPLVACNYTLYVHNIVKFNIKLLL